jgi:hypothetical protein
MKTIKTLVLFFVLASLFSCNKNKDENSDPDFKVLGITSVTINGKLFSVSNGTLLDLDKSDSIIVTGTQTNMALKQAQIEYVVWTNSQEASSVSVESNYPDVSISINKKTGDKNTSSIVRVTRNGYDEQLIYKFTFTSVLARVFAQ